MKSIAIKYFFWLWCFPVFILSCQSSPAREEIKSMADEQFVALSIKLLKNIKNGKEVDSLVDLLADLDPEDLNAALVHPNEKKAFWINTYNAFIQYILQKDPSLYEQRDRFFKSKQIQIAGKKLSFDDIEHGILRSSSWKYSLGYIKNPFASQFEKQFRLAEVDYRIHFALNCGAASCPPIAIYEAAGFDQKIESVSKSYLNKVSKYNAATNQLKTTVLFSWFRGDFGGREGILNTLSHYKVIPPFADPSIKYNAYNWELKLANYYEE